MTKEQVIIKFEPFEKLTSEEYDEIIEFIGQYGMEINIAESKGD